MIMSENSNNNGPSGEFSVGGADAWDSFGVLLQQGSLITLMAPPPYKAILVNESRVTDGKQYDTAHAMKDERQFTLSLACVAKEAGGVYSQIQSFMDAVSNKNGVFLSGNGFVGMKVLYKGMSGTSEFNGEIATFAVTFVEPNPAKRGTDYNFGEEGGTV